MSASNVEEAFTQALINAHSSALDRYCWMHNHLFVLYKVASPGASQTVYVYQDVPETVFGQLRSAKSRGQFVATQVKPTYRSISLSLADAAALFQELRWGQLGQPERVVFNAAFWQQPSEPTYAC